MMRVRYVPGRNPSHSWAYTEVEIPDDGSEPTHYWYEGNRCGFGSVTLSGLLASGKWQLEIDPDLLMDEGL